MERTNANETETRTSKKKWIITEKWMVEPVEDGSYEYIEQLFLSNDVYG